MPNSAPATAPLSYPPSPHREWRTADIGRAAAIILGVWFAIQLVWAVSSLVFLVFLATLFGLAVGKGVDFLERYRIRRGVGSALIVLGALGIIGGGLALSAPTLIEQGKQLQSEFPEALAKLQAWVDSRPASGATGALINAATKSDKNEANGDTAGAVRNAKSTQTPPPLPSEALKHKLEEGLAGATKYLFSFVSSTIAVMGAFVLVVFLAIYIGAEPDVYRGWMLAAVPAAMRPELRRMLSEISIVLRKWLVTQLVAMLVIGGVCTIVLLILDVKAPFALGFIAGLMEFVPTVGPLFSAVPAVLMGFVDSPEKAFAVVVAYWGIQFLENNLLIPSLMRGEMDLPPAITLVAQALMTLVFGFLGLMVAVPLTAAVLVPIRMIAERENAKERELLLEASRTMDMRTPTLTMRVTAEHAVADADRGPDIDELLPNAFTISNTEDSE